MVADYTEANDHKVSITKEFRVPSYNEQQLDCIIQ